jgi:hypothetical protein
MKMELRKRSFGLAVGLVCGLAMMLGTWFLLLRGQHGGVISSAAGLFYGYTYSFGGGIIGFIWGFIYGFIGGGLIAWFNDLFSKMIYKKKS